MPHVLQSGAVTIGALPLGAVPEEYLRSGFRPYGSADDLRLPSLPLGLDPGYFRSGYLAYPALSSYRYVYVCVYVCICVRASVYVCMRACVFSTIMVPVQPMLNVQPMLPLLHISKIKFVVVYTEHRDLVMNSIHALMTFPSLSVLLCSCSKEVLLVLMLAVQLSFVHLLDSV